MFVTSKEIKKANQGVFNEKVKEIWDKYETGLPNDNFAAIVTETFNIKTL